ncbi:MAG: hypothetical protein ACPGVU_08490 [Limisphaerales bacterium]
MRAFLACVFCCWVVSTEAVVIAEQGRARLPIVVASESELAHEFATLLQRISGAEFQITTNRVSPAIYLGKQSEFPVAGLDGRMNVNGFDGVEAFAIQPKDGSLYLVGATSKGVSHAAFTFLHELGCRWFFSGRGMGGVAEVGPNRVRSDLRGSAADSVAKNRNRVWVFRST